MAKKKGGVGKEREHASLDGDTERVVEVDQKLILYISCFPGLSH